MVATFVDSRGRPIPQTPPGIILLPNIDADGRRLPRAVEPPAERPVRLDFEAAFKSKVDNELFEIGVQLDAASNPASAVVSLQVEGPLNERIVLLDAKKARLPAKMGGAGRFTLPMRGSRRVTVFVEATSLRGTPLVNSAGSLTNLVLDVDGVTQQRVPLTIAPFLIDSSLDHAQRLYICEIEDSDRSNFPSRSDVKTALDRTGVAIVEIPMAMNLGDAWIQDQIQTGFCHAPDAIQRMILHLPRSASDAVQTGPLVNLKELAGQHFPSSNFGLFQDFWKRRVGTVEDAGGVSQPLQFESSFEIHLRLESVNLAWSTMAEAFAIYARRSGLHDRTLSFIFDDFERQGMAFHVLHRRLAGTFAKLERFLTRVGVKLGADPLGQQLPVDRSLLRQRVQSAKRNVSLVPSPRGDRLKIRRTSGPATLIDAMAATELVDKLALMHDSVNYGGNVEVSPPMPDAPLGKVVVGSDEARQMDRDLEVFLSEQGLQPLIAVDTSWLHVGHVDEIMAFVRAGSAPGFAIAFASPALAIRLLREAIDVKLKAATSGADLREFFLTRMLRGKAWSYAFPEEGFDVIRPPYIHRQANLGTYSEPGRGHTKQYEAAILPERLFEDVGLGTNEAIQEQFINPLLDPILASEFPGTSLVPLPVLFDETAGMIVTSAYTPNMANLQVVNGVLLVPRPYGPRMGIKGAIETLKRCLHSRLHAKISAEHFRRSGLLDAFHWELGAAAAPQSTDPFAGGAGDDPLGTGGLHIRPPETDLQRIARQFADGFLEGQLLVEEAAVRRKIEAANRTAFDAGGRLRPGWRRLQIPDPGIDLFEAAALLQLEELGNEVRFVDSWYYHVRHGEIHCGTNVLRSPSPAIKWWELPAARVSSRS